MKAILSLLIYIYLLSSVAVSVAGGKDELQPVTLQLKWFHQFQFAGYYAALHQGFYHEEGLDVTIKPGGPNIHVDAEVLSGRADFGVLASELIEMRTSGKPLVLLAVIMQHSIRAIIVRADSGINGPADLIGKQLMINLNENAEFQAMFAAEGLSYKKLSITPKDRTANSKFIEGEIDGLNGSIGNQPFIFSKSNIAVKAIRPISYGIDFYGDSLFTSENYLTDHPEQVKNFRRATLKGWDYALNNIEEIINLILAEYSPANSREHLLFEANAMRELILPDLVEIGHISVHRIERIAQLYADLGLVPDTNSVKGFIYDPVENNTYIRKVIFVFSVILIIASVLGVTLLIFNSRLKKRVAEQTEKLRSSNSLLKAVIEGTTDAIFLKNLKGQYLLANSSTLKAIGKAEHEVIGKDDSELFPATSAMVINEVDSSVIQSGQPQIAEEQLETSSGVCYWLANKSPYRDPEGNIIGLIGISRDISDLKKIETEKKELHERLIQAQKMESIGTLAGGIAHDFNNILGAILGYAEMIQEDSPEGSRAREDIDQVIKASHRAKELVKQILAFSRQTELEQRELQPALIVKEAVKMLRPSLPTTIDIQQDIDSEVGIVLADPTQIHQILTNLTTNAFHAMEETGGTLSISVKNKELKPIDLIGELDDVQPGLFVQISVGDSGSGIAPDIKNKIFDPYFTTKETGRGTGMGLSIVHGIVKNCGGFISLQSELGEGSTFQVFLPIVENEQVGEIVVDQQIQFGKDRILFIDDEKMLTKLGKEMLERLGYHVTLSNSSLEALALFQNQPSQFDLVITDQTMPGMTGVDLARRMIQMRPDIPIILCTGFSSIVSEEEAKLIGIREFAFKPLSMKNLSVLIRKVLET
ncbi:MAG: PAS domain S-box-containing protein [Desulforhopalus sp.]|jgi:PAS domain S-box-containing protein